jgi:hypothetical protein
LLAFPCAKIAQRNYENQSQGKILRILSFPPAVGVLQFASLEEGRNPAGKDIRHPIQIRFRDAKFPKNLGYVSSLATVVQFAPDV